MVTTGTLLEAVMDSEDLVINRGAAVEIMAALVPVKLLDTYGNTLMLDDRLQRSDCTTTPGRPPHTHTL